MSAGNVGKKKDSGKETSFPTNADFRQKDKYSYPKESHKLQISKV